METLRTVITTLALALTAATPAFAASTTKVYSSGILVLVFLGFCALVVVAQLIPAIITLVGMIKSTAASAREKQARVKSNI
ncbi:hypothetical protein [Geobacter sp. DSM 9736]|uniref:hypothetical protein n=1 Tax=Geobacter sp. DSM 9736 TaxID=1277350 RepID=UPI000B511AE9|nr:hypothetical protein [Geobacter sp. DSM 9736]SNB47953.1 hypothetical protein SAMN06269301_3447 [Geobacter sp. DSM 9736]